MEQEWGCEMGRRRVMFYLRQEDAHRDYFNALRKGTRHAEVSVEAWSAHDKSCYLKPSSQLAVPVPRQSYLGPKPDSRWCVGAREKLSWQDSPRRTVAIVGGEAIAPLTRRPFGGVRKGKAGKEREER